MSSNPYEPPASTTSPPLTAKQILFQFAATLCLPVVIGFVILLATNSIDQFFFLLDQVAGGLICITGLLAIPFVFWMSIDLESLKKQIRVANLQILWLAPLIVIPFGMLVWGAVCWHARGLNGVGFERWQVEVLHYALHADMVLVLVAIIANRARRWFVGLIAVMLLLVAWLCGFTAACGITGDWL